MQVAVIVAICAVPMGGAAQSADQSAAPIDQSSKSIAAAADGAHRAAEATGRARQAGASSGQARLDNARQVVDNAHEHQESQQRAQAAQRRERLAVENLEQARLREQREQNETLRRLRSRERKIAERVLAQTRAHNERLAEINSETNERVEALAERKGEVLDALDAFAPGASAQVRRDEIDPLFDRVLALRSTAHQRFRRALDDAAAAEAPVEQTAKAVDEARNHLQSERSRLDQLDSSKVWERRVAVAQAALDLEEQRHRQAREVLQAYRDRVREYHSQFGFFAGTIEPLLERISDSRRDAYFSVSDSQNWEMAVDGVRTGLRALEQRVEHRLDQLDTADLAALEFWAWLWGLLWRLVALIVVAHLSLRMLVWLVDRLCAELLRRRLLRRKAAVFVKAAEMLRALSRPALFYVGIAFSAHYAAERFHELLGLAWMVDAIFIYWLIIQASRVAILPRSYRRKEGEASADELTYIDQTRADTLADVTGVDLARARKLLGSIRVVVIFWLLATYIPDFVQPLTGITVLWWLVDQAATWGFIAVVYWVLSRWRDEIAALFDKLAGERLAPAVSFVNRHKDRPWGVLIIAVTSLYVLGKEIVIVMRRYALNTDWFKRLSALAFRTQIELQSRARAEKEEAAESVPPDQRLDPEYLSVYEQRPLSDEDILVERDQYLHRVVARLDEWNRSRRRGSVALIGDAGIGKTTLLNRLVVGLDEDDSTHAISARFDRRIETAAEIVAFFADLFELDERPADKSELIDALCESPGRIVVLDECHLCFSRHIEGFEGIDALLDIVHLCDHQHFFVLSFARHAWHYVNRIEERGHYFGEVLEIEAWSPEELQTLIERRNEASGYSVSFAKMVAAHAGHERDDELFDVIETSRGYFRYLHEFSGGNPRVAMVYWLASVHPSARPDKLDVDLFDRPDTDVFDHFDDDHWFLLAALVQHGRLDATQLAEIVQVGLGFCSRALDYFAEHDVVDIDADTGLAALSAFYWRPVMRKLASSNYLYGA